MEKTVTAVLTLLVVLTMLDVAPVAAEKPLTMPKTHFGSMASARSDKQSTITCPNGDTCLDTDTCCLGTNGAYFCCAIARGNCCFDYTSCCRSGYVCDDINDGCLKVSSSADVLDRFPFLKK